MRVTCRFIILLTVILAITAAASLLLPSLASADEPFDGGIIKIHYFYATACEECDTSEQVLGELNRILKAKGATHKVVIVKYEMESIENGVLLQKYFDDYRVPKKQQFTPIVFVGDSFFAGEKEIAAGVLSYLGREFVPETRQLAVEESDKDEPVKAFKGITVLNVLLAGLINGLNPCSLSMLLFFLSLLMVKPVSISKMGGAYAIGKFIMYLLLGTLLFDLLARLNVGWYQSITKTVLLAFVILIAGLNIKDFFMARKEIYNKITTQLPTGLRKLNHIWIKKFTASRSNGLLLLGSFLLGLIISVGEFLCTGQIFLATIVYVLKGDSALNIKAFIYLVLYTVAFVSPVIAVSFVIARTKAVFDVSEAIRKRLPAIKLANAIVFLIFGLIVIFLF